MKDVATDRIPRDRTASNDGARSTITYPGGKAGAGVYQTIINEIPSHSLYVEPFAGGGAIRRLMRPSAASILIDADTAAVKQLRSMKLQSTIVVNADAISFISAERDRLTADTVIYVDPPYPISSRRQQRPIYRYELTDSDHERLLQLLTSIPAKVLISGYSHPIYSRFLKRWRVLSYSARTRGGSTATEYLWMNFEHPTELHDTQFVGKDYRERERIKRLVQRWQRRYDHLEPEVQQKIREHIQQQERR